MHPVTPAAFRRIAWPFAVAETIVWAAMFYSFPALLLEWERDLGWSKTELSGAFTLALAVSALLAPVAGRLIDHGLLLTHLLPLLDERGVGAETAILAASMIGPMQVAGRLAMMSVEHHVSTLAIAAVCFVAMATAALALLGAGTMPFLLVTFVLLHGAGYGVTSIVRPVVIAELLGRRDFGLIAGLLAVPFLAATAVSPIVAALVWEAGGYNLVIGLAIIASVIGLLSLLAAVAFSTSKPQHERDKAGKQV